MGPDLQLAVRLDWDWLADCTVYRRQKVKCYIRTGKRDKSPSLSQKLNFMRLLEAKDKPQCTNGT